MINTSLILLGSMIAQVTTKPFMALRLATLVKGPGGVVFAQSPADAEKGTVQCFNMTSRSKPFRVSNVHGRVIGIDSRGAVALSSSKIDDFSRLLVLGEQIFTEEGGFLVLTNSTNRIVLSPNPSTTAFTIRNDGALCATRNCSRSEDGIDLWETSRAAPSRPLKLMFGEKPVDPSKRWTSMEFQGDAKLLCFIDAAEVPIPSSVPRIVESASSVRR